uniref:Uncharacterized protein n=1 Tax=Tetranychus urticae TaxID=32264 RepID=T1L0L2_TETUR
MADFNQSNLASSEDPKDRCSEIHPQKKKQEFQVDIGSQKVEKTTKKRKIDNWENMDYEKRLDQIANQFAASLLELHANHEESKVKFQQRNKKIAEIGGDLIRLKKESTKLIDLNITEMKRAEKLEKKIKIQEKLIEELEKERMRLAPSHQYQSSGVMNPQFIPNPQCDTGVSDSGTVNKSSDEKEALKRKMLEIASFKGHMMTTEAIKCPIFKCLYIRPAETVQLDRHLRVHHPDVLPPYPSVKPTLITIGALNRQMEKWRNYVDCNPPLSKRRRNKIMKVACGEHEETDTSSSTSSEEE